MLAYGAFIYLCSTDNEGRHYANLVCSKSRVAPVKTISLPRLELCASLLLAKLQDVTRQALKLEVNKTFLWSDSTVALHWIKTPAHLLKTFVSNRVAKIQEYTLSEDWRHVPSSDNPADLVSRGQMPDDFLQARLWPHGPEWLTQHENTWPQERIQIQEIPEMKAPSSSQLSFNLTISQWNLLEKYSSLTTLKRVVAYCLRFIHNAKGKQRLQGALTVTELDLAINRVLQITQARDFSREIDRLTCGETINCKSPLLSLNPFMDQGLLRVGGRLSQSELPFSQRHPILLPRNHPIRTLIIRDVHTHLKHAGNQTTLYAVRESYWPIDGRNVTRRIINQCYTCFRAKPRGVNYVMGNLPAKRLSFVRAFLNSGIDYCGPFNIKERRIRNRGHVKCYVAVFICLATKAVHLEVVSDLTTEAFLASLKRFFSRRGKSNSLMSDNATNIVGANRELKEMHELLLSEKHNVEVERFLSKQGVSWSFIPPRAPHFGGLWEAAVKSFKHHMLRIVGDTLLTLEQFHTYVVEIEAILNSRPLSPLSSDPNDYRPLTPGHFLIGESLMSFPQADLRNIATNRLSAWQHVQAMKQHFWARWHKEYLNELNVRTKWKTNSGAGITLGTMVVLRQDKVPPMNWSLGRVTDVHPGSDGIVRVVTIRTEAGTYKRSVSKICPLPSEGQSIVMKN